MCDSGVEMQCFSSKGYSLNILVKHECHPEFLGLGLCAKYLSKKRSKNIFSTAFLMLLCKILLGF